MFTGAFYLRNAQGRIPVAWLYALPGEQKDIVSRSLGCQRLLAIRHRTISPGCRRHLDTFWSPHSPRMDGKLFRIPSAGAWRITLKQRGVDAPVLTARGCQISASWPANAFYGDNGESGSVDDA